MERHSVQINKFSKFFAVCSLNIDIVVHNINIWCQKGAVSNCQMKSWDPIPVRSCLHHWSIVGLVAVWMEVLMGMNEALTYIFHFWVSSLRCCCFFRDLGFLKVIKSLRCKFCWLTGESSAHPWATLPPALCFLNGDMKLIPLLCQMSHLAAMWSSSEAVCEPALLSHCSLAHQEPQI